MWYLRSDKLYASFAHRSDLENLDKGVFVLDFGALRQTVEEARRDADHLEMDTTSEAATSTEESSGAGSVATPTIKKEDIAELGSTTHKIVQQQESIWGYCAVAELVLENRTAFVGVCIFCDVVLTAGPARGSRSSAETDAFAMVSDIIARGISNAVYNYIIPNPNPAEDIFLPSLSNVEKTEEDVAAVPETTVDEDDFVPAANTPIITTNSLSETEGDDDDEDTLPPIDTPTGQAQSVRKKMFQNKYRFRPLSSSAQ